MQLLHAVALSLLPLGALSTNVILSNDDGWAEANVRAFYKALFKAGDSVVISAPAENKSGSGSLDVTPAPRTTPCEFNSCPANSPPTGADPSNPRINYVNSFPVTAMKYGIQTLSRNFFASPPDIALAGPNVGANLGITTQVSGTVGAATEASKEGIPGIAFSGTTGSQISYMTSPQDPYVGIYADLATNLTQTLTASGKPFLPSNTWLNVNFAAVTPGSCDSAAKFQFILTRIYNVGVIGNIDVNTCGAKRLPDEKSVVGKGCYASVSVGKADTKLDASAKEQAVVLAKLKPILSCLPNN